MTPLDGLLAALWGVPWVLGVAWILHGLWQRLRRWRQEQWPSLRPRRVCKDPLCALCRMASARRSPIGPHGMESQPKS